MATQQQYVQLAQSLPPRLMRFFARYPPAAILRPTAQRLHQVVLSEDSSESVLKAPTPVAVESNATSEDLLSSASAYPNPFRAQKHPITGRWHNPVFSLRRQADLVKLARKHGVEELLPYTVKGTAERLKKREETGLQVKGTGVGQKVKGKAWERTMKGRLEKRRQAMLDMPQMIQTWKE
ncbi:MAG: hypothetical protein M1832_000339, partial [Thelocarpon impressellum]